MDVISAWHEQTCKLQTANQIPIQYTIDILRDAASQMQALIQLGFGESVDHETAVMGASYDKFYRTFYKGHFTKSVKKL